MHLFTGRPGGAGLWIECAPFVRRVRTDNFRAAPLDALQLDVFAAFVATLPVKGASDAR